MYSETVISPTDGRIRPGAIRLTFWLIGVALGLLNSFAHRFDLSSDGLFYFDMADAYLRKDWNLVVNGIWSPLYPGLLSLGKRVFHPSAYWELPTAHLVNFTIYAIAFACFDYFWRGFLEFQRQRGVEASKQGWMHLSERSWIILGYTLFIWSSLVLITLKIMNPDMAVSAFVYLASGLLLRMRRGSTGWLRFGLYGVVLGLAYLAKAVMFPLGLVFLVLGAIAVGNLRRAIPRIALAIICFLLVAGPFMYALSKKYGHITYGEAGRLGYAVLANRIPLVHWQGGPPGMGIPEHPTRKLLDLPRIYEFGTPIGGTYPVYFDPCYWYVGVTPHFDLKEEIRVLFTSSVVYADLYLTQQGAILAAALILWCMSPWGWSRLRDLFQCWNVLIPGVAALGLYGLVYIEWRYVAPFVVLVWIALFSAVRLPASEGSRRLGAAASTAVMIVLATAVGYATLQAFKKHEQRWSHPQWQAAEALKKLGAQPGDKVGSIGDSFRALWAHLDGLKIVAEVPADDADTFWGANPSIQTRAIEAFAKAGAKFIIADKVPRSVSPEWRRLGNTNYYAYVLRN